MSIGDVNDIFPIEELLTFGCRVKQHHGIPHLQPTLSLNWRIILNCQFAPSVACLKEVDVATKYVSDAILEERGVGLTPILNRLAFNFGDGYPFKCYENSHLLIGLLR